MILLLVGTYLLNEREIKNKGVYTIAHLTKATFEGSESGWMFQFEYYYNSKRFERSFGGPMKEFILTDSIAFIKVFPESPEISGIIESFRVPDCLQIKDAPQLGWKELPTCNSRK